MSEFGDGFKIKHEYKIKVLHNGMIEIESDYMIYSAMNENMGGLQSQYGGDNPIHSAQHKLCISIVEAVRELEKLAPEE